MKRLFYLLCCLILGISLASAQTVKVTGTVVAEDGEEVIGASIVVKGTPTGTVTNFDGTFQLDVPQSATTLVVSYIGMKTQEVTIKSVIHITLQSDSQSLDEVVVVGYGTQRKKDVTSAISRVGGEDLSNLTAASFDSQLAGRAAGVQVYTLSGVLGAAPEFQIRGSSTISSNSQPLVIVDGIPMTTGDISLYGNGTGYNALADISPNDIQSIEF
ncbi:MAG: carboxypeptidase-like regulatory domain-containing protein [Tannerellaceae bacterium]|nr:carboxypeptidase-like regulatory domain-containing protein [Tannerellaceae bacterium]